MENNDPRRQAGTSTSFCCKTHGEYREAGVIDSSATPDGVANLGALRV